MLELWQDIAIMVVSFSGRSLIPLRTSLFRHENLGLNPWPIETMKMDSVIDLNLSQVGELKSLHLIMETSSDKGTSGK